MKWGLNGTLGAGMMRVPWFMGKSPLQLPGLNWALVAKSNMCVAGDSDGDGDRCARSEKTAILTPPLQVHPTPPQNNSYARQMVVTKKWCERSGWLLMELDAGRFKTCFFTPCIPVASCCGGMNYYRLELEPGYG